MSKTFLTAEWRKLAMANYAVDKSVLEKYLPFRTELDVWNGNCYISLVGFMFMNTRLRGLRIPFHEHFEEVNLRFYVRYKENNKWKRGVVFIKEIVPKRMITFVANTIYGENYETMPMKHLWRTDHNSLFVEYSWKKNKWNSFSVHAGVTAEDIAASSQEEFITEHFWGYTHAGKAVSEYEVQHPRWKVYPVKGYSIDVNFASVYGEEFGFLTQLTPSSVFLAEGSEVFVKAGKNIR